MVDPVPTTGVAAKLHRYWWLFLIRGLFGLALGAFALSYPVVTVTVLVLLIGAYLIADGMIAIVKAVQILRSDAHWWLLMDEGILGVAVGFSMISLWPVLTIATVVYFVGYWAIFSGAFTIASAVRLRTYVPGEWLYLLFGVVSIAFGAVVLFKPGTGLDHILLMLSIYGFVMGVTMLALAFRALRLPA